MLAVSMNCLSPVSCKPNVGNIVSMDCLSPVSCKPNVGSVYELS